MPMPRKEEMSPAEIAACDAVKALRKSLGMGQGQFAKLVGTLRRTISRWENHIYCPQNRYLKRLKEIEKLSQQLDMRDRLEEMGLFDKKPPRMQKLAPDQVRKLAPRLLSRVLREVCGGRVRIPKPELHGRGIPKLQMKLDPERNEIVAFVRREQQQRRTA